MKTELACYIYYNFTFVGTLAEVAVGSAKRMREKNSQPQYISFRFFNFKSNLEREFYGLAKIFGLKFHYNIYFILYSACLIENSITQTSVIFLVSQSEIMAKFVFHNLLCPRQFFFTFSKHNYYYYYIYTKNSHQSDHITLVLCT